MMTVPRPRRLLLLLVISQTLLACHSKLSATATSNDGGDDGADQKALVTCTTTKGPIALLLHRSWSPRGYDRAAELFERGYYDGSHFFRVLPQFLVQFGLSYTTDAELKKIAERPIQDDPKRHDLMPFREGMISFAGSGANSRTSQLFFAFEGAARLGESPWETPFGYVLQGMDVVRNFHSGYGEQPKQHRIRQGASYIEENFPLLDSFDACAVKRMGSEMERDGSVPTFALNNGITVPLVGLGSASGVHYPHVKAAIEHNGYRYVDTAQSHSWGYREEDVGRAVREARKRYEDRKEGGSEEYVYVQTKIHPQDLGYRSTKAALQLSLKRLQVSSLDSVLLHKPHCWEGICAKTPEGTWKESWSALEEAYDEGLVRSIGMCDITPRLLEEMLSMRIGPTTIQNWFDPFHQDKSFRQRVEEHNKRYPERKILYQAYSTLGTQWKMKGYDENPVLNDPTLQLIAMGHGMSVPQVVIQWATRRGVMVLPASKNASHQVSNLNSFGTRLSDEEMQAIDNLDGNVPPPKVKEVDPNQVELTFVHRAAGGPVNVFWVSDSNEEVHVGEMKGTGDVLQLTSYHGHNFVFKEEGRKTLNRHVVDKTLGSSQNHEIEDRSDEF